MEEEEEGEEEGGDDVEEEEGEGGEGGGGEEELDDEGGSSHVILYKLSAVPTTKMFEICRIVVGLHEHKNQLEVASYASSLRKKDRFSSSAPHALLLFSLFILPSLSATSQQFFPSPLSPLDPPQPGVMFFTRGEAMQERKGKEEAEGEKKGQEKQYRQSHSVPATQEQQRKKEFLFISACCC